ncbi:hypothetical protein DL93DRAFT_2164333 [Clavulina sp. PMI_390]|nr:hypothetical protein DL93DRAFT_2164333 [Clavulina sp. PMI_390]
MPARISQMPRLQPQPLPTMDDGRTLPQLECVILRSGRGNTCAIYTPYTITAKFFLSNIDAQTFRALSFDHIMVLVNKHCAIKRVTSKSELPAAPTTSCDFSPWKYNDATRTIETTLKIEIPDEYMGYEAQTYLLRMRKASLFHRSGRNAMSNLNPFLRRPEVTLSATVYIAPFGALGMGSDPCGVRLHRQWRGELRFQEQRGTFSIPPPSFQVDTPQLPRP